MTTHLPSWLQDADVLDEPTTPTPAYTIVSPTTEPRQRGSRWTDAHTDFVIHKLGKNTPPAEIVMTLVQKYGCSWGESERFVSSVSVQHRDKIKRRQRPMMILITLGTLLGAVILIAYSGMRMSYGYVSRRQLQMLGTGLLMLLGGLYGVYELIVDVVRR